MSFLFGAAYYDEYMPCDRLERDIALMKQAGVNTVRIAESTWGTLEPQEGSFCFSSIDRVLEAMKNAGIRVIVGTPTYAIPSWLARRDPDVMVTTKDGRARYGHRQLMDIINPTYRRYAELMIRELVKHTAGHPSVIGFQLDNETKHYGTAGQAAQQAFRKYLEDKFQTVENLNHAFGLAFWSNALGSWDDLPDIRGSAHGGLACEFEKFQRTLVTDFLAWQADIVRMHAREDQFITHNFDFEWKRFSTEASHYGYSWGVQPDVDHYTAAKCLTVAGVDIYHMTQDELTGAEIAFGGDIVRSLKGEPYLVLETQAQGFKYWLPYPGQLRLQAYSHLASGARGLLYWHWHSTHNGFETYWKGLLGHDFESNPTYEEAALIGRELAKLHKRITIDKQNKAAVLVSNDSLSLLNWFPIDKDLVYNDVFRWMYDALYELNVECDILFPESENFNAYNVIAIPALYSAPEPLLLRLREYIEQGGVVVASYKSAVCNEYGAVYHDTQPHMMHDCFGFSYNQFTAPNDVGLDGWLEGEKAAHWMELLKPASARTLSNYIHPDWHIYAAATCNDFGKGRAYYLGCHTSKSAIKTMLRKALEECGLWEGCGYCWPVIVRKGLNEIGEQVTYFLNYSRQTYAIPCPYDWAEEALAGREYLRGRPAELKPWGVLVFIKRGVGLDTKPDPTGV